MSQETKESYIINFFQRINFNLPSKRDFYRPFGWETHAVMDVGYLGILSTPSIVVGMPL